MIIANSRNKRNDDSRNINNDLPEKNETPHKRKKEELTKPPKPIPEKDGFQDPMPTYAGKPIKKLAKLSNKYHNRIELTRHKRSEARAVVPSIP